MLGFDVYSKILPPSKMRKIKKTIRRPTMTEGKKTKKLSRRDAIKLLGAVTRWFKIDLVHLSIRSLTHVWKRIVDTL